MTLSRTILTDGDDIGFLTKKCYLNSNPNVQSSLNSLTNQEPSLKTNQTQRSACLVLHWDRNSARLSIQLSEGQKPWAAIGV